MTTKKYFSFALVLATLALVPFSGVNAVAVSTITVGAQVGSLTEGTGGTVTYDVTLTRLNTSTTESVPLTVSNLPAGATVSYDAGVYPYPVVLSEETSVAHATLQITTTNATPGGVITFDVSADGYATGQGTLTIASWVNATVSGSIYNDIFANGAKNGGDAGLSSWTIVATPYVEDAEDITRTAKTTTSAGDGTYSFLFGPADAGEWRISEVVQTGWKQTEPNGDPYTFYPVTVSSASVDSETDFGNWHMPEIIVTKWNDVNNDGIRNMTTCPSESEGCVPTFTEPLIANWPFFIAENYGGEGTVDLRVVASGVTDETGTAHLFFPVIESGTFLILEGAQSGWNRTYPVGTGVFGSRTVLPTFENGVTVPSGFTLDTGTYFSFGLSALSGQVVTTGHPAGLEEPTVVLQFGNYQVPVIVVPPPPTSGGGNGPIVGTFGVSNPNGLVLGVSTTTINPFIPSSVVIASSSPTLVCERVITEKMGPNEKNSPEQVKALQTLLRTFENADIPTGEDGVYGPKTLAAVKVFQLKYADEILKPWGLTASTGVTYLTTRLKLNNIFCAGKGVFTLTPEEQKIIDQYKLSQSRPVSRPIKFVAPAPNDTPAAVVGTTTTFDFEPATSSGGFWPTLRSWFGGSN